MIALVTTLIAVAATPPQVTRLSLPFQGIWGVIQGFDSGSHVRYAAFALDFVPAQPKTTPAPRPGAPLAAFACYGRPVLAPADGTVVRANGDARDWPAYQKGSDPGNYVIIQHAPGEYSELRHLRHGSVQVKAGERVRRGQRVAACGNSGNAKTPHLHIGFLGSVDPIATRPMVFSHYQVLGPDGRWGPGQGALREKQIVRPVP